MTERGRRVNALLVRVGADISVAGGSWNSPVDSSSGEFVYVPIPEAIEVHPGLEKPYASLTPALAKFGVGLPTHLRERHMHLDPDFAHLTYGDRRERAKQLQAHLCAGDMIVFYAGLADLRGEARLVYAVVGLLVVDEIVRAFDVPPEQRDCNAHTRRLLSPASQDVVVRGRPRVSGRLQHCLPIGEYRDRAYRVRRDLLEEWGGLSVRDGYLQRSARLPRFLDADLFLAWLERQQPVLIKANN